MLRWTLFSLVAGLTALGLLTVVRAPDWCSWRCALLAGEFGHWLALLALVAGAVAGRTSEETESLRVATMALSVVAAVLLAKPCGQAFGVASEARAALDRIGAPAATRAPFSITGLLAGGPARATPETRAFAGGLKLDCYRAASREGAPCVIVVHGGGWDGGERTQLPALNGWLAQHGYAVAAVEYRLAPEFRWPAQRDDVLAAIAYLKTHAAELGIDPDRLVLLGRSAGGQIAETVAYTADDPAIRGVVGLYAPADLHLGYESGREDDELRSRHLLRQYLGGTPETARAAYDSASATMHVTAKSPPTLLLHGTIDTLVWQRHAERLSARLSAAGVPQVYVALPWATHAFDFNLNGPGGQITTYALERFLARVTESAR